MPGDVNFDNRTLYHGDNLDFLHGMNSETVHLIATDPPFNKNRDVHATPNSVASGARFEDRWDWDRDVHESWVDSIRDDWPGVHDVIEAARSASGDDMAAYLCWMGVRLIEMRRILRPDGSIYIHLDSTAHAWVKALMDGIFGKHRLRNEIIWAYTGPGSPQMRQFSRKHDTILWYAIGDEWTFNGDAVRMPHRRLNTNRKGAAIAAPLSKELRDEYLGKGKIPESWWPNFSPVGRIARERTGYPTQKPLALYERIIGASSNPGDIVLDPFCGCATTPIAAERLGRQWVGMDIWEGAYQLVQQRIEDNRQLLADPDPTIHYLTIPPVRSDENDDSMPRLRLRPQRPREDWQRLTHRQIRRALEQAQRQEGGMIICAGCGRELESEFMQLDHIQPRVEGGANDISNRILLCGPCNRAKGAELTLEGLIRRNRRDGWTRDADVASIAVSKARSIADRVRDFWGTPEIEGLIGEAPNTVGSSGY